MDRCRAILHASQEMLVTQYSTVGPIRVLLLSYMCFADCNILLEWHAAVTTRPGTSHNLRKAAQPRCSPEEGLSVDVYALCAFQLGCPHDGRWRLHLLLGCCMS